MVVNEAQLEGGLVLNQMTEDFIRSEFERTGSAPTEERMKSLRESAEQAAFYTTMINMPLIHFSNKVVFDNILKPIPGLGKLSKEIDLGEAGGFFVKGKTGYKAVTGNLAAIRHSANPRQIGGFALNYMKANLMEAFQENAQEATSAATINYWSKLFENPYLNQAALLQDSVSKGIGEQFTGQGLETFFSGFLTGGLVSGIGKGFRFGFNQYQKLSDPAKWESYKADKAKYLQSMEESLNYMDKNFLNLGHSFNEIENPNAVNAAQQAGAAIGISNANENSDTRIQKNLQDLALSEHVYNAIRLGKFDEMMESYQKMLALSDEDLMNAYPDLGLTADKLRDKIDKSITRAKRISARYDKYSQIINPVSLNNVAKGTPEYNQLLYKRNAIETVKKLLVMSEEEYERGAERMQDMISNIITAYRPLSEVSDTEFTFFLQPDYLAKDFTNTLQTDIKSRKERLKDPALTANERRDIEREIQTLTKKAAQAAVLESKLKRYKESVRKNDLTADERQELFDLYNGYIETLSESVSAGYSDKPQINVENVKQSFQAMLDYIHLSEENKLLNAAIGIMTDPQGFATTVNSLTEYFSNTLNNADFLKSLYNRAISVNEDNAIYNVIWDKHKVFVIPREGELVFYDPITGTYIYEGDERYEAIEKDWFETREGISDVEKEKVAKDKKDIADRKAEIEERKKKAAKMMIEVINIDRAAIGLPPLTPEEEQSIIDNAESPIDFKSFIPGFAMNEARQEVEEALQILRTKNLVVPYTNAKYYVDLRPFEKLGIDVTITPDDKVIFKKGDKELTLSTDPFYNDYITLLEDNKHDRVSTLVGDKKGSIAKKYAEAGTLADRIYRKLFATEDHSLDTVSDEYDEYIKEGKDKKLYRVMLTDTYLKNLYATFLKIKASLDEAGIIVVSDIPTLWGTVTYEGKERKVAGTIDFLGITEDGSLVMIDLKTTTNDRTNTEGDLYETYKLSDSVQQSAYAELLSQQTGLEISKDAGKSNIFILQLRHATKKNTKTFTEIQLQDTGKPGLEKYLLRVEPNTEIYPQGAIEEVEDDLGEDPTEGDQPDLKNKPIPPTLTTVKVDLESLTIEDLNDVAKQLRQKAVNAREAEKQGKTVLGGSAAIESDYQKVKIYISERELEAKKAEIEKRRQEELNQLSKINLNKVAENSFTNRNQDNNLKSLYIAQTNSFIPSFNFRFKERPDAIEGIDSNFEEVNKKYLENKKEVDNFLKFIDIIDKTTPILKIDSFYGKDAILNIDKLINAKYDAELAALEEQSDSGDTQEPGLGEAIHSDYEGKLVYGTPGSGKTSFVKAYNANLKPGQKEAIDVDDLLLARLKKLRDDLIKESNVPVDDLEDNKKAFVEMEFTNSNLPFIIIAYGNAYNLRDADAYNKTLYAPVLSQVNDFKQKGNVVFTGSERFIQEADYRIIAEDRINLLESKGIDRKGSGRNNFRGYQTEENKYIENSLFLPIGKRIVDVMFMDPNLLIDDQAQAKLEYRTMLFNLPFYFNKFLNLLQGTSSQTTKTVTEVFNIFMEDIQINYLGHNVVRLLIDEYMSFNNRPLSDVIKETGDYVITPGLMLSKIGLFNEQTSSTPFTSVQIQTIMQDTDGNTIVTYALIETNLEVKYRPIESSKEEFIKKYGDFAIGLVSASESDTQTSRSGDVVDPGKLDVDDIDLESDNPFEPPC